MSGYGAAAHGTHAKHAGGPISVPWVILAGLLIGVGLTITAYMLYYLSVELLPGTLLVLAGCLMLFHPRAGADRA
ncbi:MAG TPA: hypothetical protein VMI55_04385 [Thermoplasmata archaeon]|nr:hypothetical protein [Thermoplasmata archaeon]